MNIETVGRGTIEKGTQTGRMSQRVMVGQHGRAFQAFG